MSADATGYVWKHSPYKGVTLLIHLAVADVVNDANGNEFWMLNENLAVKVRCGRSAVVTALTTLCGDGFLVELERGGGRGIPTRYRFLTPKTARNVAGSEDEKPRDPRRKPRDLRRETARSTSTTHIPNRKEEHKEPRAADAPQAQLDGMPERPRSQRECDPLVAEAHALVERVFANRPRKPLPKFLNVRALAQRALESGWTAEEVERVMMLPDTVFTMAGLETGRARASNANGTRAGDKLGMVADHFGYEVRS